MNRTAQPSHPTDQDQHEYDQRPGSEIEQEFNRSEPLGPRSLVAAQQLPPDLMLLKMENESIMAIARAQPRNQKLIVKQLQELIDSYPEAADEAIYVKPVGTEIRITCGDCHKEYVVPYVPRDGVDCPHCDSKTIGQRKKVKKFAEGLSIRAAESIRSIYGYNRLSVTMETIEGGSAKISGVFIDYATGTMTADTRIVSPFYTDRFKKPQRHPEDRFYNVLVKAEKSKLRRDVILDSVPNTLKAAFRDMCEKKLTSLISEEKIVNEIIPWFAKFGLTVEQLEKIIGRPKSMGWTEQDGSKLRQIASALKNEETTVAELLDDLDDSDGAGNGKEPPPGDGGAGLSHVTEALKGVNPTNANGNPPKPPTVQTQTPAPPKPPEVKRPQVPVDKLAILKTMLVGSSSIEQLDENWKLFFNDHVLGDAEMDLADKAYRDNFTRIRDGVTSPPAQHQANGQAAASTPAPAKTDPSHSAQEFVKQFAHSKSLGGVRKTIERAGQQGFDSFDLAWVQAQGNNRLQEIERASKL